MQQSLTKIARYMKKYMKMYLQKSYIHIIYIY